MKKSTKNSIKKWIFILLLIFAALVMVIPAITLNADSPKLLIDFVDFFTKIKTNVIDNVTLYLLLVVAGSLGYYFLFYKPSK